MDIASARISKGIQNAITVASSPESRVPINGMSVLVVHWKKGNSKPYRSTVQREIDISTANKISTNIVYYMYYLPEMNL